MTEFLLMHTFFSSIVGWRSLANRGKFLVTFRDVIKSIQTWLDVPMLISFQMFLDC